MRVIKVETFDHTHQFIEEKGGTIMIDSFEYKSPLRTIGIFADKFFLEKYMSRFITNRAKELKRGSVNFIYSCSS